MIHLETRKIKTLEEVRYFLQKAIELEHATIPPYLTAYYSLYGNINADIRTCLREIAVEEMLHMALVANVLNAIGGTAKIDFEEFIPSYPAALPLGIGSTGPGKQLIVPLEPFSKQLLKNVFMEIEEPEAPVEFPVAEAAALRADEAGFEFSTIGEFYAALKRAISQLGGGIFTGDSGNQVDVHAAFAGSIDESRVPKTVTGLASALRALDVIVEQGRGTHDSPLDENSGVRDDYAHYYKLASIYHGRELRQDPTTTQGYSFTGKRIGYDPDEVYPMIANLKLADLKPGSEEHTILLEFNRAYTQMLRELDSAFSGSPATIRDAINTMRGKFDRAATQLSGTRITPESLVNLQIDPHARYNLTPSFEYAEPGVEQGRTRFDRVIEILDESVGGPSSNFGAHRAFWRGKSRDDFVAAEVFGLTLFEVGNGAASNLVKALKGQAPFGANLPAPPMGARFSQMPAGGFDPVPDAHISFIETWIDDGCPEDRFEAGRMSWRPTNAPVASSRTDDIWFSNPDTGWAVNSNGTITHTKDGGESWNPQLHDPEVYFRCIDFADGQRGWSGTLTLAKRLFMTDNGGASWSVVGNLPDLAPSAICGISVVSRDVVYASGTNYPDRPASVIKTTDGGASWTAIDMKPWADLLIDCFFTSETRGWVVGGKRDASATQQIRDNVQPVVLLTEDGGQTWVNRVADIQDVFPLGEWGWKIQFLNDTVGFISLENLDAGAILKTLDGGLTWTRLPINDPQKNANLEGVGFVDENHGWVGGWGDRNFDRQSSSETLDGGLTWRDANEIGTAINRFRFFGNPVTVGYASGLTVYKYAEAPAGLEAAIAFIVPQPQTMMAAQFLRRTATAGSIHIPVQPENITGDVALRIWDRFGQEVATVTTLSANRNSIEWDLKDSAGKAVSPGDYILRITLGEHSESSVLHLE